MKTSLMKPKPATINKKTTGAYIQNGRNVN